MNKVTSKEEKAREIIEKGLIEPINDDVFFVTSQTNNNKGYEVIYTLKHCECKFKELNPEEDCKHLLAIKMLKTSQLQKAFSDAMLKAVSKIGGVKV